VVILKPRRHICHGGVLLFLISLQRQVRYLGRVTDKNIGDVLAAYRKKDALKDTYVIVISDHGQIPTLYEDRQELATDEKKSPFAVLKRTGFRVRRPLVTLPTVDPTFQAFFAYQGFMAYVYLADRSTCEQEHQTCDWVKPPRFNEDVCRRSEHSTKPIAAARSFPS
jgi:hypothetical protein